MSTVKKFVKNNLTAVSAGAIVVGSVVICFTAWKIGVFDPATKEQPSNIIHPTKIQEEALANELLALNLPECLDLSKITEEQALFLETLEEASIIKENIDEKKKKAILETRIAVQERTFLSNKLEGDQLSWQNCEKLRDLAKEEDKLKRYNLGNEQHKVVSQNLKDCDLFEKRATYTDLLEFLKGPEGNKSIKEASNEVKNLFSSLSKLSEEDQKAICGKLFASFQALAEKPSSSTVVLQTPPPPALAADNSSKSEVPIKNNLGTEPASVNPPVAPSGSSVVTSLSVAPVTGTHPAPSPSTSSTFGIPPPALGRKTSTSVTPLVPASVTSPPPALGPKTSTSGISPTPNSGTTSSSTGTTSTSGNAARTTLLSPATPATSPPALPSFTPKPRPTTAKPVKTSPIVPPLSPPIISLPSPSAPSTPVAPPPSSSTAAPTPIVVPTKPKPITPPPVKKTLTDNSIIEQFYEGKLSKDELLANYTQDSLEAMSKKYFEEILKKPLDFPALFPQTFKFSSKYFDAFGHPPPKFDLNLINLNLKDNANGIFYKKFLQKLQKPGRIKNYGKIVVFMINKKKCIAKMLFDYMYCAAILEQLNNFQTKVETNSVQALILAAEAHNWINVYMACYVMNLKGKFEAVLKSAENTVKDFRLIDWELTEIDKFIAALKEAKKVADGWTGKVPDDYVHFRSYTNNFLTSMGNLYTLLQSNVRLAKIQEAMAVVQSMRK